ncbi:MAG TPA: phenylalanine--tRNA ligase subunit alpha, partial [Casimicrobiaceae bacterium]
MIDLDRIVAEAQADFAAARDPASLENAKAKYLGKTGAISEHMKALAKLGASERPAAGAHINHRKAL